MNPDQRPRKTILDIDVTFGDAFSYLLKTVPALILTQLIYGIPLTIIYVVIIARMIKD